MDRPTVIAGQIPLETDILRAGQFGMVGNAKTNEAMIGTATCVSGFTLVPSGPASLAAILGPGIVFQQQNLEAAAWSSMPADTHTIIKQGIALDAQNLTFTPPTTVGYSQAFLVEVAYQDVDAGPVVRPYYNASNPSVQFNGPGGAGTADNTIRKGAVAVQVKAGIAATSGTQVTPSPDSGFVGIFVVTLAQGATTVTAGNITAYSPSSFIPATLPGVPSGVQNGQWVYGAASGTNTYSATLFSTAAYPFSFTTGMEIIVYFANANTTTTPTLNCNGLGAVSIKKAGGGSPSAGDITGFISLVYDGANWRINGLVTSDVQIVIQNGWGFSLYNAAGTYTFTVPAGVTKVKVRLGAGGGGSNASGGSGIYTAGAGGGGYSEKLISGLTPGSTISAVVGAGGAAAPGGSTGGNGTSSSFGAYCSATGGPGASATATSGVAGGLGVGGDFNVQGGGGSGGLTGTIAGNGGMGGGGGGPPAPGGNGGTNPGNFPGGGAAGAPPSTAGAVGAGGYVYISWGGAS